MLSPNGSAQTFPGTTSLDGATLIAHVRDVFRDLVCHGARSIVIVDGHCENQRLLTEA